MKKKKKKKKKVNPIEALLGLDSIDDGDEEKETIVKGDLDILKDEHLDEIIDDKEDSDS